MVLNATFNIISVKYVAVSKGNNQITEHEQSSKGKGKTHKSTNRQNQSITGKL